MAVYGWRRQNHGLSWVIVGCSDEIMTGRGWSWVVAPKLWLVVGGRGLSNDLVEQYLTRMLKL